MEPKKKLREAKPEGPGFCGEIDQPRFAKYIIPLDSPPITTVVGSVTVVTQDEIPIRFYGHLWKRAGGASLVSLAILYER